MPGKRRFNFLQPLWRHPFAQQYRAALQSNPVHHQAAERRSRRCHQHIQQETHLVVVDVGGDHHIHGQADEGAIEQSGEKYAPNPQRLHQRPEKGRVLREDGFEGFHAIALVYVGRDNMSGS